MKKIFSLFAAVLFAGSMMAETITITPESGVKSSYGEGKFTISDVEFAYAGVMYTSKGTPSGFAAKQFMQFRKSGSGAGEIKNNTQMTLKSIAIATQNDKAFTLSVGTTADALSAASDPEKSTVKYACQDNNGDSKEIDVTLYTFDVAGNNYFAFVNGSNAQYIAYITIEVGEAVAPAVAKPTFTPETAEFDNEVSVSLACETEGAEIFYTLDGTAPTAEATKYEAAFKLTKTTTVKAIAIKGEDKSAVATKTYTKALPTVLPDTITCELAAELALAGRTDNVIVKGYVVAIQDAWSTYKNVSFWMADTKDGSNTFEAYRVACETAEEAPAVGDLVWVKGTLTKYSSTPETKAGGTFGILEKDLVPAVNLGAKTIEEFLALKNKKDTCILTGVVENIKMDSKDNTQYNAYGNFDLRDETGKVYIYGLLTADGESKKFIEMNINEGDELTVLAIYAEYNSEPQVNDAIFVSVKKTPTAIDNTAVEAKTFKTFENGQLVIIKNGIKYNATGAVIR